MIVDECERTVRIFRPSAAVLYIHDREQYSD